MIMYLLMMLTAAVVSYAATWGARLVGNRLELYSPIRSRDMHSTPVSRLGGLGIFAGVLVALVIASQSVLRQGHLPEQLRALGSPRRGRRDRARRRGGRPPGPTVVGQAHRPKRRGPGGGHLGSPDDHHPVHPRADRDLENEAVSIVLTAGLIVTTMNAFNFIDGLDGLAAGVAIIGGAAFFLTAYWVHRTAVLLDRSDLATLLTAVVVGSCVGFLPHNWFPSKIFMGDSGAMLIGLLMASAGVVSTGQITLRALRPGQRYPHRHPDPAALRRAVPAAAGPGPRRRPADCAGPFAVVGGPRPPAPQAAGHRILAPRRP